MIEKRDKFLGSFIKQLALKLRWCRMADCSRGNFMEKTLMSDSNVWAIYAFYA